MAIIPYIVKVIIASCSCRTLGEFELEFCRERISIGIEVSSSWLVHVLLWSS